MQPDKNNSVCLRHPKASLCPDHYLDGNKLRIRREPAGGVFLAPEVATGTQAF
jgi:hypothetical protein